MNMLTDERIKFIADKLYKASQDDSTLVSIKRLEAALEETETAIENLWSALEHGQSVERITKRIDAREEEKKEIEKQLAIEKRKNRAFSYPQILAYLDYMQTIGRNSPTQRSILINTFVHSVYLYDDHFTIIFNGGKGQISAENIPFKKIEKSIKSGEVGTNLCSAVVTSVPPNKVDSFDTIGIETIDLILFAKMLMAQGFSAFWQIGLVSLCSVKHSFLLCQNEYFTPNKTMLKLFSEK